MTANNGTSLNRRDFIHKTVVSAVAFGLAKVSSASAAEPTAYQVGCYTRPWDHFEYRVALDGIAEAGYKYAGIMTAKGKSWVIVTPESTPDEIHKLNEEVKARGLKALSIYGSDFPVSKSVDAGIEGLNRLIDHCTTCSCPHLLLGGTSEPKLTESYYKVVAECCDYAAAKNVTLTIKPHGGTNATGPQCRRIIEQVGKKNFGLWYDPGNIFYYSDAALDPVEDSRTVNGLVLGMSVKDFEKPKEVLVTPGTGMVNFRGVMQNLQAGGFRSGPIIVECLAGRETPAGITEEARKALRFVEEFPNP